MPLADRVARVEREFERCNWDDPRVRMRARRRPTSREVRRVFVDRTRRLASTTTMVNHNVVLFGFDQGQARASRSSAAPGRGDSSSRA